MSPKLPEYQRPTVKSRRWPWRGQLRTAEWFQTSSNATTPVLLTVVVILAALLMTLLGFGRTTVESLIMLTAVVGLYSYSGITGIPSFGHAAYMAIGGYAAVILTVPSVIKSYRLPGLPSALATTELSPYIALPVAWLCGVFAAAFFGLVVWRLTGLAASIATLALLLVLATVIGGWEGVTGGRGAVPGVPQISSVMPAVTASIAAIWLTSWFQRTRWGRFAQAAREDEPAAQALGIRINVMRWLAMSLSGGTMAVSGALYVYFVGSISPDFFYLSMMFNLLAMLVIGGMLSVTGAVVGTITVEILRQLLGPLDSGWSVAGLQWDGRPGLRLVVLGAIMLLILAKRPGGMLNGYELRMPQRPWFTPRDRTRREGMES